jgi:hypothetical protein
VFSCNPLHGGDQEANLLGGNRKLKMTWFEVANRKTTREPPRTKWRAKPTDSSVSQNEER